MRRTIAFVIATVLLTALSTATLKTSDAAFVATTSNDDNAITALTVAPPTAVDAVMSLNVLPLLTCRVELSWVASTTPGVTGYEIVRVVAATGAVDAGPWTVAGTSTVDDPVPLQLLASSYEWRVRTILDTWRSDWQPATPDFMLACLL